MSGIESSSEPLVRYITHTVVLAVRQQPEGNYIHFEGSRESILLDDCPFQPGDQIKITFEKVPS